MLDVVFHLDLRIDVDIVGCTVLVQTVRLVVIRQGDSQRAARNVRSVGARLKMTLTKFFMVEKTIILSGSLQNCYETLKINFKLHIEKKNLELAKNDKNSCFPT